jgi:transposase-like protein
MGTEQNTEMITSDEPVARRRFRSKQERRHGVNANQVFLWRKLCREGRLEKAALTQLIPVRIGEVISEEDGLARPGPGTIHIELGRARVRLEGSVDPGNLRLILEHLGG